MCLSKELRYKFSKSIFKWTKDIISAEEAHGWMDEIGYGDVMVTGHAIDCIVYCKNLTMKCYFVGK